MDAASIAGTIHDRLIDLHGQTEPWGDGTSIDDVQLAPADAFIAWPGPQSWVLVTASDGTVYRVTVEPWP